MPSSARCWLSEAKFICHRFN